MAYAAAICPPGTAYDDTAIGTCVSCSTSAHIQAKPAQKTKPAKVSV
jgi:hypothetical protein